MPPSLESDLQISGGSPSVHARSAMDELNRLAYAKPPAAKAYERNARLQEGERVILRTIAPQIRGKQILDIGVGGGRTTPHLLDLSSNYTAIDYSPAMVEAARRRFDISSIYCCDARDMRRFGDGVFDFILFSFNGLDYVPHGDRLKALREIHRTLASDGLFMFSSHNRSGNAAKAPWNPRNCQLSLHWAKTCVRALVTLPRHWQMRQYEVQESGYAVLNDPALGYSLLTYYIDGAHQLKQLAAIGFAHAQAFDVHGQPTTGDHESPWIYYLARK